MNVNYVNRDKEKEFSDPSTLKIMITNFYRAYRNINEIYSNNIDSNENLDVIHHIINLFYNMKIEIDQDERLIKSIIRKNEIIECLVVMELIAHTEPDENMSRQELERAKKDNEVRFEKAFRAIKIPKPNCLAKF